LKSQKKNFVSQSSNNFDRLISTHLLNLTVLSTPIAFFLIFLAPSYFSIVAASKMIFTGSDGNCVLGMRTLGVHCFGDYGTMVALTMPDINPWGEDSPLGI
jgi:hypothetical protein